MLQLPKSEASSAKIEEAQKNFNLYKISYEKLRDDVNIKLQFLDENRVRHMFKASKLDVVIINCLKLYAVEFVFRLK